MYTTPSQLALPWVVIIFLTQVQIPANDMLRFDPLMNIFVMA